MISERKMHVCDDKIVTLSHASHNQCRALKHCTTSNHGHCAYPYCDVFLNICEESSYCAGHCISPNHNHCTTSYCANKTINLCEESSICIKHCITPNHGHCAYINCNEFLNVCEDSSQCLKHCKIPNHSHCVELTCGLDSHTNSTRCTLCKEHFEWISEILNLNEN